MMSWIYENQARAAITFTAISATSAIPFLTGGPFMVRYGPALLTMIIFFGVPALWLWIRIFVMLVWTKSKREALEELNGLGIKWDWSDYIGRVMSRDLVVVRLFWRAGMSPDTTDRSGFTALHIAAMNDDIELAREVLRQKPTVDKGAENHLTALIVAAKRRHTDIAKELLTYGADPNCRTEITNNNFGGCTALFFAANSGNKDMVRLAIDAGADVNIPNAQNTTPLMIAAYKHHVEIVKLLLSNGAKSSITDQQGANALDYAMANFKKPCPAELRDMLEREGLSQSDPPLIHRGNSGSDYYFNVNFGQP